MISFSLILKAFDTFVLDDVTHTDTWNNVLTTKVE